MNKTTIMIIFFLLVGIVFNSGCIINKNANETWGQKKISLDALEVTNNTTSGNYTGDEGTNYYYVEGWIQNNNHIDALNVEMNSTFYAADGSVVATNNTVYLEPKNIPANGLSEFYFEVPDPDHKIVNYEIKIVDARAEY